MRVLCQELTVKSHAPAKPNRIPKKHPRAPTTPNAAKLFSWAETQMANIKAECILVIRPRPIQT
eukprot:5510251-Lingulodinium_polyedra.AAC.1